jgi:6,7-dimethyl-8-ribityllumazine synthase
MIKSLHKLLVPKREQDYRALVEVFSALGLERGEAWEGRRSQGVKFEAPEAGVEIGIGEGFPNADLVIETDSADVVYEVAKKRKLKIAGDLTDTDWGARIFTLELPGSSGRLAVFSYHEDWRRKNETEGKLDASGLRFGIVVSRFNAFITERLLAGARDALRRSGAAAKAIRVVRVPGSFEIPLAARQLAESGNVDAVICLGCLLRGDTAHYDVIANEVTRGIGQSAQETGVPHGFGVLTCDTLDQAIDRAGLKAGNKGFEAALAAVEMARVKKAVGDRRSGGSTVNGRRSTAKGETRARAKTTAKNRR